MRKRFMPLLALSALFVLFAVAGCGQKAAEDRGAQTLDEKVDAIVESMTTAEKVGQMVMIGVQGTDVDNDSLYMLHQYHVGGIVLFDRNLKDEAQTKKFIQDLQAQADEKVPLFIGIDEEGGSVVRGSSFITPPPSARSLGTQGETTVAESTADRTGQTLKDMGFNVDFAPVADVSGGDRSFSSDPEVVKEFVLATIQGFETSHILYALKHFPGIGRSTVDSHDELSTITASADEMDRQDLIPFQTVISEHQPEDFFILVSHLKYTAYDKDNPASLSKAVMTDLLRDKLHFDGIIITDDVEMGALAKHYPFREIGVRAVKAGADMVLVCHEYEHETDVYLGLLDAVEKGEIPMDRIDASVRRIVKAKLTHIPEGDSQKS